MYLCDIGNTNVDFFLDGKMWSISIDEFKEFTTDEKVYYINVNSKVIEFLEEKKNFIDLEPYFNFDTIYQGMGSDRIAACYTIKDGMIVDAGSAISVDIMSNGIHLGGFLLPGLSKYKETYASISPVLDKNINLNVSLEALPQSTRDAVSYGILKPILMLLKDQCKYKHIYFTGGDGQFFSRFFKQSIYDKALVFRGMRAALQETGFKDE